jgi:hypothetical protein
VDLLFGSLYSSVFIGSQAQACGEKNMKRCSEERGKSERKEERGKNKRNVNFTGLNQGEGAKIKAKRRNYSLSQEGEKFIRGWGVAIWFSYRYPIPCLVQWQKARFFTTRSPVRISRNIAYFPPICSTVALSYCFPCLI